MELEEIPCPLPVRRIRPPFAHFLLKTKMDTNNTEKKLLPFSGDNNNNAFLVALVMSCQTDKCTLFWIGPFHLLFNALKLAHSLCMIFTILLTFLGKIL